jgi:hypothetical protein
LNEPGHIRAMSEKVTITLSRDEALVLFEFLLRFTEQQQLDIRDQAEQRVLWDILADLESALPEPWRTITTGSFKGHVRAFATQRPNPCAATPTANRRRCQSPRLVAGVAELGR